MKRIDIIVVGAGAAGMTAAITAARSGAEVVILEHMDTAGKKILATGNGKCNYTNSRQGVGYYYGDDPAFVLQIFEQFGHRETLDFFEELGISPKEKNGYYYPASEQASSVREVLLMELRRLGVSIRYHCGIRSIQRTNEGFIFDTKEGRYKSRLCLLATGGCSAKKTGSDGSGFLYLKPMGHHIVEIVPALVQLQGKQSYFKEIAGIRADAELTLYCDDTEIAKERGELQLTELGISGIPVFQFSRIAAKALLHRQAVRVRINFSPEHTQEELTTILQKRFTRDGITAQEALVGLYPFKLIGVILKLAGVDNACPAVRVSADKLEAMAEVITSLRADIVGTKKLDTAQATAGGVDTREIENETLESKLVPGLYFAGEMIDIDGRCGGYNLQWAWSSGYVAGSHAALRAKEIR